MDATLAKRIEWTADGIAAALFGAAAAFPAWLLAQDRLPPPLQLLAPCLIFALAAVLGRRGLRAVGSDPQNFELPAFEVRGIELADELLLTDVLDRSAVDQPLLLDDILAELGPDARVVRLFDPAAMPTAGQLKARIDRHLDLAPPAPNVPDDSQALHEALAELRRSFS